MGRACIDPKGVAGGRFDQILSSQEYPRLLDYDHGSLPPQPCVCGSVRRGGGNPFNYHTPRTTAFTPLGSWAPPGHLHRNGPAACARAKQRRGGFPRDYLAPGLRALAALRHRRGGLGNAGMSYLFTKGSLAASGVTLHLLF